MIELDFNFTSKLWLYKGKAAWHLITLPEETATQIKFYRKPRRGFGSIPVSVTIGKSKWKTSIFPDKAANSFILPIKAEIRKNEKLAVGDNIAVKISLFGDVL